MESNIRPTIYVSSLLAHIALLFYAVCLPEKQLSNRHWLTLEIMRFSTSMSLTRNPRSDLLPSIIKVCHSYGITWSLAVADDDSYPTPQLPNFQLGVQTHFAQVILWTARHPNRLLSISPTSSPVRLGNRLGIVFPASKYLFSSIHCFVMTPVILGLLLMPSTTLPSGRPHEHIHIQPQLQTQVSEAISTNSTRKSTSSLLKNEVGPQYCPPSNGNWPWLLLQRNPCSQLRESHSDSCDLSLRTTK